MHNVVELKSAEKIKEDSAKLLGQRSNHLVLMLAQLSHELLNLQAQMIDLQLEVDNLKSKS